MFACKRKGLVETVGTLHLKYAKPGMAAGGHNNLPEKILSFGPLDSVQGLQASQNKTELGLKPT